MSNHIYSICHTIHPATSVEHSVECHFYNLDETNLVVAGSNRLNVYRIIDYDETIANKSTYSRSNQSNGNLASFRDRNEDQTVLLEHLQTFELYGTVASLTKIKLGNRHTYERDSLVMSFPDAKLSIVQYNPQNHDLKSVSMHYFEDDLRGGYVTNHLHPPIARVDPENRCIAMVCYGKHIVVIPVDKDEEKDLEHELYDTSSSSSQSSSSDFNDSLSYGDDDDDDDEALKASTAIKRKKSLVHTVKSKKIPNPINYVSSNNSINASMAEESNQTRSPVLPSYIIDLNEEVCGEKIDNIVDIQFLHNYNNPTLVLLYESNRTWSGRIAMKQDTYSMVALSMNVHQRLHPIIWTVNNLPYDSLRILAVPKPIGGLLIIACNEIIYLNQSVPAFGITFNCFTKESSNFPLNNIEEVLVPTKHLNSNNIDNDNSHSEHTLLPSTNDLNNHNNQNNINNSNNINLNSSNSSNGSNTCENSNSSQISGDNEPTNDGTISNKKNCNDSDLATEKCLDSRYLNITLDLSQSVFLDYNKILFILKDGDVYLVTLFNDDMRSIKKFNFEHVAKTVQPNCLTLCENSLVFIGSHVGDSILAEIVGDFRDSRQNDDLYNIIGGDETILGGRVGGGADAGLNRLESTRKPDHEFDCDSNDEHPDHDPNKMNNNDNHNEHSGSPNDNNACSISLREQCKLISTSACGRICYGEVTNISDNQSNDHKDPYVELIVASGYQENGSICVLHRTIKPIVEDTYELKDCDDLWTLKSGTQEGGILNSKLLLDRRHETIPFSTKGELLELKPSETVLDTTEPTIFAANMGAENLIIQITSSSAKLISDDVLVDKIEFDSKSSVIDACMSDYHVIALTNTSSLYHIQLGHSQQQSPTKEEDNSQEAKEEVDHLYDLQSDEKNEEENSSSPSNRKQNRHKYALSCQEVGNLTTGQVVSLSLYKDYSGIFFCGLKQRKQASNNKTNNGLNDDVIDDDDDLYNTNDFKASSYNFSSNDKRSQKPTYWLFLVDDRGVLDIFSIPNFTQVYSIDNFPSHPILLQDNIKLFVRDLDSSLSKTKEILMIGMGYNRKRPILMVRSENELIIYEAYTYQEHEPVDQNHLKIRFKKINTLLLTTILGDDGYLQQQQQQLRQQQQQEQLAITQGGRGQQHKNRHSTKALPDLRDRFLKNRHWLRAFKSIGGYEGVFLQGFRPHWIIMGPSGSLRLHPMNVEGSVYAFSQFIDGKFIYFTEKRELRIASLPRQLNLELQWPMRKLYMGETVHFVNYHVERRIYCVVTSTPKPCSRIMKVGNEPDSMKIEDLRSDNGYIPPTTEQFKLRLYDPENWEQIPDCEIEFEEWEQVTCVKNVSLASEGTTSGLKGYIALSTNYCYGEDVPNRGRIFILDLIEVVPEPDRPLTKNKIKKVYCQEQKGPVTTLSHTCGLLMSAVGQKIYLWQLKEEQLDGVAFIDTQIYIHCAASVKNLILVSDVYRSVSLLRYQQETRTLSMICRDTRPLEVFACDFVIDNHLLNFVVTDSEKNIILYAHDPEHEESYGGTRLLRRADFHLGAHVTSFCRLKAKVPAIMANDPEGALYSKRKHLTMFCTVDGGIGHLYPISEAVFRQFQTLQNELTVALPHVAGLNPKAWRCIKQSRSTIVNPCKLILDGDLVNRFLSLSSKERNDLARKIGSSTDRILADIQLVQEAAMYF